MDRLDRLEKTKKYRKRIECQVCSHQFDAAFYKEDPGANDIECCLVCGAHDFKFITFRRKIRKERKRSIEEVFFEPQNFNQR